MKRAAVVLVLVLVLLSDWIQTLLASYPRAHNVTWSSLNFKTFLTWEPKPSADYSYTVEFFRAGEDRRRTPHCLRSSGTQCDLSSSLTQLTSCYTAEVLSEPPLGVPSHGSESPHQRSPRFCPYNDTDLSQPDFKLQVSKDQKTTTLFVSDPLTAIFKDGRQLTLRDVFAEKLHYKVTYRKNRSTGKKELVSATSVVELTELDPGRSYCFSVQAFVPSRVHGKQLGEPSRFQCSEEDASFFTDYSAAVIAAAFLLILLLVGIVAGATVGCYKQRRKALQQQKEAVPLAEV